MKVSENTNVAMPIKNMVGMDMPDDLNVNDVYSTIVNDDKLYFDEWESIISSGNIFDSLIFDINDINNFIGTRNSIVHKIKELNYLINDIKTSF